MTRRYEREILELVERKEREHRGRERVQRARRTVDKARHRVSPVQAWERLGAISWMAASLTLAIIAFVLHTTVPTPAAALVLIAVILFFVPVIYRPTSARTEDAHWRGQIIDLPPRDGPFQGIRRRIWQKVFKAPASRQSFMPTANRPLARSVVRSTHDQSGRSRARRKPGFGNSTMKAGLFTKPRQIAT